MQHERLTDVHGLRTAKAVAVTSRAPGGIRTRTVGVLNAGPLPIGLRKLVVLVVLVAPIALFALIALVRLVVLTVSGPE